MIDPPVTWLPIGPLLLLLAVGHAATDFATLFDGPYRTEAQTTVPIPTQFTDAAEGIAFHGWAQIPSWGPPGPIRPLFRVESESEGVAPLLSVSVQDGERLSMTVAIASGTGTALFTGLNLSTDSWISFGIRITPGQVELRATTLVASSHVNQASSSVVFVHSSSPGTAIFAGPVVAVAPSLTPLSAPVSAYLAGLRVLTVDQFSTLLAQLPAPYWTRIGADVAGLVYEKSTPPTNVTCPGRAVFAQVRTALYGRPIGVWPQLQANPLCDSGDLAAAALQSACLGRTSCIVPQSNEEIRIDPCSGRKKFLAFALTCSSSSMTGSAPARTPSSRAPSFSAPVAVLPSPSSSPVPSSAPALIPPAVTSRLSSRAPIQNVQAWQVTFPVSVPTLGPGQYALRNALVRDLAAVLNVPTSRFARVEFRDQTDTSTVVAVVLMADVDVDPDGTVLLDALCQGLQTPGSAVRTISVLSGAPPPPVPIDIGHVPVQPQDGCDNGDGASGSCPGSAPAYFSGQGLRLFWIGAVVGVCVVLAVVICCWVRVVHPTPDRSPQSYAAAGVAAPKPRPGPFAPVSFGTGAGTASSVWGQSQSAPDGAPYPPVVPAPSGAYVVPASSRPGPGVQYGGSYYSQNDLADVALDVIPGPITTTTGTGTASLFLYNGGSGHSRRLQLQAQPRLQLDEDGPDF